MSHLWTRDETLPPDVALRVNAVCDSFEAAWKAGSRPQIEDVLGDAPDLERQALLRELVLIEVEYRRQLGQEPSAEEYRARFPALAAGWLLRELGAENPIHRDGVTPSSPNANVSTVTGEPCPATPAAAPTSAGILTTLGDYELMEELGKGGMGIVYLARQRSADRLVAVKVIRNDRLEELEPEQRREWLERFRTEGKAAARIEHDHVVTVYEVGESDGRHFYSMRYINGKSLADIRRDGPVPGRRAAAYLAPIARAVHQAHTCQIVHRDLKPQNILVDASDRPFVADFGLAKWVTAAGKPTDAGRCLGTPSYMSPEQARDASSAGPASDIYGLGAVLYDLLTGRPPFQAADPVATLHQVLEQDPVSPRQLNRAIDRDLETICLKCLEKEPVKRYGSAEAVAMELERWLRGEPIKARPVGSVERLRRWCRRKPAIAGLTAAVVLVLFLGAATAGYFALVASRWEKDANVSAADASEKGQQANEAKQKAKDEEEKKDKARAAEEVSQAQRLLLTLAHQQNPKAPFNDEEKNALRVLTESTSDRLRLLFVEVAVAQTGPSRPLLSRLQSGVRAAVGADRGRRRQVEHMLLERLREQPVDSPMGENCARVASALDDISPELAALAAPMVLEAMRPKKFGDDLRIVADPLVLSAQAEVLVALARGLDAKLAGEACRMILVVNIVGPAAFESLLQAFAALAERLDRTEVLATARAAVEELGRTSRLFYSPLVAPAFAQLAGRLDHQEATVIARGAVELLSKQDPGAEGNGISGLVRALWLLSDQLTTEDLLTGACAMVEAVGRPPRQSPSGPRDSMAPFVAPALLTLTARLDSEDGPGSTRFLLDALGKRLNGVAGAQALPALETVMLAMVAQMGPEEKKATGSAVVQALARETKEATPAALTFLAGMLGKLTPELDDEEVAGAASVAIEAARKGNLTAQYHLERVLAALVARLEGKDAAAASGIRAAMAALPRRTMRSLLAHKGSVRRVVFSPDGKRALSAGGWPKPDGTVRLWDVDMGREVRQLTGHTGQIMAVAFSADGKLALAGGSDRLVYVWSVETGEMLGKLQGHTAQVNAIVCAADGRHALSVSSDTTVRVWDLEAGKEMRRFTGHTAGVLAAAFSPDGRHVASSGWDKTIRLWDFQTTKELQCFDGHTTTGTEAVAFLNEGRRLISGGTDRTVRVWDIESGKELWRLPDHPKEVYSLALLPDGRRLITACNDGFVRLWDLENKKELRQLRGHQGTVWHVAISPDGRSAISGGADTTVRLWGLDEDREAGSKQQPDPVIPLAIEELRRAIYSREVAMVHNSRGLARHGNQDLEGAALEFLQAMRIDPTCAQAYYNHGRIMSAKQELNEATESYRRASLLQPDFAEAHCHFGLGLRDQGQFVAALEHLREGHRLGSRKPNWRYPSAEWIKECERLVDLERKLLSVLEGKEKPADNAERLALADVSRRRLEKLYVASYRFYTDAFAADARLADDTQTSHRYDAACVAVLAGCSRWGDLLTRGADADKLDDSECARLRQQAVSWLRADLAQWTRLAESGKPSDREVVQKTLLHWQADPDLAGIRAKDALTRLPADEAERCRKLWADVETMLKKSEDKGK